MIVVFPAARAQAAARTPKAYGAFLFERQGQRSISGNFFFKQTETFHSLELTAGIMIYDHRHSRLTKELYPV